MSLCQSDASCHFVAVPNWHTMSFCRCAKVTLRAKVTHRVICRCVKVTHRVILSLCQSDPPCQSDAPCHFVAVQNCHTVSFCRCAKVTLRAKVTHRVDLTTVSFCRCVILTRSHTSLVNDIKKTNIKKCLNKNLRLWLN